MSNKLEFWLSRNPKNYGGGYILTSYQPKKYRDEPTWFYWSWNPGEESEMTGIDLVMTKEQAMALLLQVNKQIDYKQSINLNTQEIVNLADAPDMYQP